MLFNSLDFLIFFPIVCVIYFVIPHKFRYIWLLVASYYFYMCWNAKYALLIAASTVITYLSGIAIQRFSNNEFKKRTVVFLSVFINLAILFFFKYYNFAIDSLQGLFSVFNVQLNMPLFDVMLPVGISFYTFQALSYTIDVYRGDLKPEKNLLKYALFVSFFPQLVAGPIERSKNLLPQLSERHYFDAKRVRNGLLLMLWGFFEKLVIADRAAIIVNEAFENIGEYSGIQLIVIMMVFAFQIYGDFGGYSHIAIGAAEVLGFKLMDNFKQPYFAVSIQDFWKRWHISLSSWLQDYVFIPLVWSRWVNKLFFPKTWEQKSPHFAANLIIVFAISGIWHGAAWNYVLWGLANGFLQVIGNFSAKRRRKVKNKIISKYSFTKPIFKGISILTTFTLISFTLMLFRSTDGQLPLIFNQLIHNFSNSWLSIFDIDDMQLWLVSFAVGVFILLLVDILHENKIRLREQLDKFPIAVRYTIYIASIWMVLGFSNFSLGGTTQFIYFQF